jgi:signal peptidase I
MEDMTPEIQSSDKSPEIESTDETGENCNSPSQQGRRKYFIIARDILFLVIQMSVVVMIIINFIGRISIVQGSSMAPSLENENRVLINLLTYHFKEPERGDIIVFRCPTDQKRDYIKRVIALPGEEVEIKDGIVYINDSPMMEDYITGIELKDNFTKILIPPESVYVMGDNRINSEDSRYWGTVNYKLIRGKANLVFWPLGSFHVLK